MSFSDFIPSGNQAVDPDLYDIENQAIDHEGVLWRALIDEADWAGKTLVDLGCGSGWWLPCYADAQTVIGIEPDTSLLPLARQRAGSATVLHGSAEHIPLGDSSVDVVHARFAYFFPHPEFDTSAGLNEVARVLRPGGRLVVIDNDTEEGEFAELLRMSPAAELQGQDTYAREWWKEQGATTKAIMSSWRFANRTDLEDVLRLEFPSDLADGWLDQHPDRLHITYGYLLHTWTAVSLGSTKEKPHETAIRDANTTEPR